jgi:hypothetical protein
MNLSHRKLNEANTEIVLNKETGQYEIICLETGEVLNRREVGDLSRFRFDFDQGLRICQAIREGKTIKQIGDDTSYPSLSVIAHWRKMNPTFDEEIKLARKQRAEYYHDKVIDLAEKITDDDNVAVAKFKADQYRWAAEKGDPASYGNKIEHTGSNVAPSIIVFTGIDRSAKPDIIEVISEQKNTGNSGQQISDAESGGVQEDGGGATEA